ncbi:AfsR/SARP family transcriptional regulator [Actinokineospora sp. HUAS TT18]|uniref:AfsR/SARP family transcriptional regulator n=1 Tax=Actinokineospora sp. HUAS TT18 TaxID=3447451 RepID=UPI003F527302
MEVRLLGPFEVIAGEQPVVIGRRRERCLLAVLALEHGRVVPVERLVELLWDDEPPPAAVSALRTHVSRLRAAVPSDLASIESRAAGYTLRIEPNRVDSHRFHQLVAEGQAATEPAARAAAFGAALELWRGPALAGLADDPAIGRLCHGLAEARLGALDHRIEADLALGRHRDLVPELVDLTAAHPERERFTAHLVLALYRSGRQSEALAAYERHRRMLGAEFGLDPGPELRALHERVLRNDPALDLAQPAVTDSLPYDVPDYTGRAADLAALLDGSAAITTIDGMAGVGKTAFALHLAHRLADRYPDGRLFVDLHAHSPGQPPVEPAACLETLLRAVGVPAEGIPATLDERAALWRSRLAGRRVLIVLDNAADAAQVRPLLPGAPGCQVLVTSRRRLPGLAGAVPVSLDVLSTEDAVALFTRVVPRAAASPEAVSRVVALCGGLPLAIRIAAARLLHRPLWTVDHLADLLGDERLAELAVDDQGVGAAFTLSYEQLDPEQQRVFRLLGCHPGVDFDARSAAALADLPVAEAERVLESLLDVHLLLQRHPGRYLLHDLVAVYARELAEPDACAVRRLLDYYLAASARVGEVLVPGLLPEDPGGGPEFADHADANRWCAAELPNLVAAVRHAAAVGLGSHAWLITRNLTMFLLVSGHFDDHVALHAIAIEQARRAGERTVEVVALINLGTGYLLNDQYRPALEHLTVALGLARAAGDRARQAGSLARIAALHHSLGDPAAATTHAEAALAAAVEGDTPREECFALWVLSTVHAWRGDDGDSLAAGERVVSVARRVGDPLWEQDGLVRVAAATSRLGHHAESLALFAEALEITRRIEDRGHEVEALLELAAAHLRHGDPTAALTTANTAADIVRLGCRPSLAAATDNALAEIYAALGDPAATGHAERARSLATSIENAPQRLRAEGILTASSWVIRAAPGTGHRAIPVPPPSPGR